MHIVLWNGFAREIQVFHGSIDDLHESGLVETHMKEGNDVIYFYATIAAITLRAY